jgi:hypothetical protein
LEACGAVESLQGGLGIVLPELDGGEGHKGVGEPLIGGAVEAVSSRRKVGRATDAAGEQVGEDHGSGGEAAITSAHEKGAGVGEISGGRGRRSEQQEGPGGESFGGIGDLFTGKEFRGALTLMLGFFRVKDGKKAVIEFADEKGSGKGGALIGRSVPAGDHGGAIVGHAEIRFAIHNAEAKVCRSV